MLWGLKEQLKPMKELLDKRIESKLNKEQKKLKNYKKLASSNNCKSKEDLRSRPRLKKQNFKLQWISRKSWRVWNRNCRKKGRSCWRSMQMSSRSKLFKKKNTKIWARRQNKLKIKNSKKHGKLRRLSWRKSKKIRSIIWRVSIFQINTSFNFKINLSSDY